MAKKPDFEEYTLPNGLVVGIKRTPAKTALCALRVNHGSLNEKEGEKGLAHFLEHCIIGGGTENYGPDDIERKLDAIEGSWNATTTKEYILFNAEMLSESVRNFLDIASEIFFIPRFDPVQVERERQRIIRELEEEETDPRLPNIRIYRKALYREHPIRFLNEGHIESLQTASIAQLKNFHQRGFGAQNMNLILVGDLPDDIKDIVYQSFAHTNPGQNTKVICPALGPLNEKVILHLNRPGADHNKIRLNMGVRLSMVTVPTTHSDNYAVRMLFKIFSGSQRSRLQKRLSQQEGLTYGVYGEYNIDCNAGVTSVTYNTPVQSLERSVDIMFEEIARLRRDGVDREELEKHKKYVLFRVAKSAESNIDHANSMIDFWDSGKTLNDILSGFKEVTTKDLERVAQIYLPEDRENGKYVLTIEDPTLNTHL